MTNPKKNRKIFNIILAVVLAVGVWLYVVNVENPTGTSTIRDIPVTVTGQDTLAEQGLMITGQSDDSLSLKLTGRKKTLMKLTRKNITLKLDVSSITTEGEHTLSCEFRAPTAESVTVSDWDDLRVTVTVEKLVTKEVPVRGEFIGTEAENCLAGTVTTNPATIQLKGPAEDLEGISYALASVGGKEISETLVETVSVVFMGPDNTPADRKNVTADQETVEVTVPVRQVVALPLTVELVEGDAPTQKTVEVSIEPKTVTVIAREDEEELPTSISLGQLDLTGVEESATYELPIRLPSGVTAWGGTSGYATVTVTFPQVATRQIEVTDIILNNLPQGCHASLITSKVYVWIRGTASQVEQVDASQLRVEADLSGLSPGDELQRVPVQVTLQEGLEQVAIMGSRYTVALRLTK